MPDARVPEEFRKPQGKQRYSYNDLLAEAHIRGITLSGAKPRGCYGPAQFAPLFKDTPGNCALTHEFRSILHP